MGGPRLSLATAARKNQKTYPSFPRVTLVGYSSAMVGKVGQEALRMDCQRRVFGSGKSTRRHSKRPLID